MPVRRSVSLDRRFFQQDESISESFIPAFDGTGLEEKLT